MGRRRPGAASASTLPVLECSALPTAVDVARARFWRAELSPESQQQLRKPNDAERQVDTQNRSYGQPQQILYRHAATPTGE
jgi:hypothetical protein